LALQHHHKKSIEEEIILDTLRTDKIEIEERLQDISQEMNHIDVKIRRYQIEAKRAELTNKELDRLTDDMKIYRQVGRMWIMQPKKVLVENLKATTALKSVEGQQMRQVRMKLEERARHEADSLKEIVGVDKFKDLFGAAGRDKPDPSKTLAEMSAKKDDDMMPIWGKAADPSSKATEDASEAPAAGEAQEPEAA